MYHKIMTHLFYLNASIHVSIRNFVLHFLCLLVMFLLKRDADKLHPLIVECVDRALFPNNNNSECQGKYS